MKTVKLDLVGTDGNAYSVMGLFRKQARKEGWTATEIEAVLLEAMSGDYDHLLATILLHTEEPDDEVNDEWED